MFLIKYRYDPAQAASSNNTQELRAIVAIFYWGVTYATLFMSYGLVEESPARCFYAIVYCIVVICALCFFAAQNIQLVFAELKSYVQKNGFVLVLIVLSFSVGLELNVFINPSNKVYFEFISSLFFLIYNLRNYMISSEAT